VPLGCQNLNNPQQTLLGAKQHDWLVGGLTSSKATWKLMGNQTFFGRLALTFLGQQIAPLNVDAWDGFNAERVALTQALRDAKVSNFLIATGDLHTYMASEVKLDYGNSSPFAFSNYLGAEFMTPAVTSSNLGEMLAAKMDATQRELLLKGLAAPAVKVNNPHIRFFDSSRQGYSTLELTDSYTEWVAYAVDKSVDDPQAAKTCLARQRKYMALPWLVSQSTDGY
jgi:alkaline phosphatase D